MKKLYSLLIASTFTLFSLHSNAATINVTVSNFAFTPSTFTAVVGDVIVYTLTTGTHNVTTAGGVLPAGAATISSGTLSTPGQSYSYTVTVAGNYGYNCTFHPTTMLGGFTATTATGIVDPATDLITQVYPSPFRDKLTVKYNGIELIEFYNVVGEKVKSILTESVEAKIDVNFDNLPSGIYFYRTYKDGIVVETRKIVKAK